MTDIISAIKNRNTVKDTTQMGVSEFIGMLFYYRDVLHLCHLSTSSYAAHKALNNLYDDLIDFIDTLVETAQTQELLNITIPTSSSTSDAISIVEELLLFVRTNRNIFIHSFQQNILDEIESTTSSAIYKLKFLK